MVELVAEDVQVLVLAVDGGELGRRASADAVLARRVARLGDAVDRVVVGQREQLDAGRGRAGRPPRRRAARRRSRSSATGGRRSAAWEASIAGSIGPTPQGGPMSTGAIIAIVVRDRPDRALRVRSAAHAPPGAGPEARARAPEPPRARRRRASRRGRAARASGRDAEQKARIAEQEAEARARGGRSARGARPDARGGHGRPRADRRERARAVRGHVGRRRRDDDRSRDRDDRPIARAARDDRATSAAAATRPRTRGRAALRARDAESERDDGHAAARAPSCASAPRCFEQRRRVLRRRSGAETWKPWANSQPRSLR